MRREWLLHIKSFKSFMKSDIDDRMFVASTVAALVKYIFVESVRPLSSIFTVRVSVENSEAPASMSRAG